MKSHRFAFALGAAAAGLLAALSLPSGTASADVWNIDEESPGDDVISVSGMPPFDQSVLEQGTFVLSDHLSPNLTQIYFAPGVLSSTQSFGFINEDFVSNSIDPRVGLPEHSVIDIMSLGGYENIYADLPGVGAGGTDAITDTLVTPFGNFDIPVTFDAAAPAAAADWTALLDPSGFAAALDADWTTFSTDLGALF